MSKSKRRKLKLNNPNPPTMIDPAISDPNNPHIHIETVLREYPAANGKPSYIQQEIAEVGFEAKDGSITIILSPLDDPHIVLGLFDDNNYDGLKETAQEYKARLEALFKEHKLKTEISFTPQHIYKTLNPH